jgi:hypothetical protein
MPKLARATVGSSRTDDTHILLDFLAYVLLRVDRDFWQICQTQTQSPKSRQ